MNNTNGEYTFHVYSTGSVKDLCEVKLEERIMNREMKEIRINLEEEEIWTSFRKRSDILKKIQKIQLHWRMRIKC